MDPMVKLLSSQPSLAGLDEWQVERLAPLARRTIVHAGAWFLRAGDHADRLYLLTRGRVAVRTGPPPDGSPVAELKAGEVLGWSWAVAPYRWRFDAVAIETTHMIELDGPALAELCRRDRLLGYELTRVLLVVVADRLGMP